MKINVIGDSHTQAIGPRLEQLFGQNVVRWQAYPGYSTKRALEALDATRMWPNADMTVILLGGNDFGDQSFARRNMLDAVAALHGGHVLWVSPGQARRSDVKVRHLEQSESQRQQFSRLGIDRLDTWDFTGTGWLPDGVHFTGAQYNVIASHVAAEIRRIARKRGAINFALRSAIGGTMVAIAWKMLRLFRG